MPSMSSEDFERALFRVGKTAHPTLYPSESSPAAIIGRRNTYRKGDATVVVNVPLSARSGVTLPKGRYSLRRAHMEELPGIELISMNGDAGKLTPYVSFQKGKFTARGHDTVGVTLTSGIPDETVTIEDVSGFAQAIIRADAIMARDDRFLFFNAKTNGPIFETPMQNDHPGFSLEGVLVLSSFTRAILREAFYPWVKVGPTSPQVFIGDGHAIRQKGMFFIVEGEAGERYTIIQPGTLVFGRSAS